MTLSVLERLSRFLGVSRGVLVLSITRRTSCKSLYNLRPCYSHTLLQIVLWMWTAGIRAFGRCAIYPVCEIIQPCTTQCIARTIRKAKISCKTSMFKPSAQRSSILLPILLFILTLLWTFFQSWYDWLMFRGVGQLRCWCKVRGNSKLPIILGLTSQQLNVLLDV